MKRASLFLFLLGPALLSGCGRDNGLAGGSGLVETTEVIVAAETQGRVLERRFDEGSVVKAGDTLAVIDPSHLELQVASAEAGRRVVEANLVTARLAVDNAARAKQYAATEYERVERLVQTSTASQRQFDEVTFQRDQAKIAHQTAEANVAALKAQLVQTDADIERLRRLLQDCFPVAPVSGIVTEKYVEAGELLAPGRAVVKLAQLDTVWVKIYLTAGNFADVTLGQTAKVSTETGGAEYAGTVIWTSPKAEFTPKNVQTAQSRADLVYAVKVSIPNPEHKLKVGMPVFVTLEQK